MKMYHFDDMMDRSRIWQPVSSKQWERTLLPTTPDTVELCDEQLLNLPRNGQRSPPGVLGANERNLILWHHLSDDAFKLN